MITFENTTHPKEFFQARLQDHIDAYELIRGTECENDRGCLINSYDPQAFEKQMGIPEWFPRLMGFPTLADNLNEPE